MRKLFLIARSNMRKAKGQTVAIVVLILLAAMLLNLWLMLSTDYKKNFDRCHARLNAEHVTLTVDGDFDAVRGFLTELLGNDDRVSEYRVDACLNATTAFAYNGGEISSWTVFTEKEFAVSRSVGRAEITKETDAPSGAYFPMIYETSGIAAGIPVEITVGSRTVNFTVCGFFNSAMRGSHNCGMIEIILSQDKYAYLEASGYATRANLCSVRLKDKSECVAFEAELKQKISGSFPEHLIVSTSYDLVSQSRYISQSVCSGVISAMAFFVLLIALVVIASNIINYMQVNIKNLGALKAAGYTSRQLVCSLLLQFSVLTVLAAIVGAAMSYAIFPAVNTMMTAQTGIPYGVRFLPLPLVFSLMILGGAVALSVWLSARRIKKIEPIVALRSGVRTHNFKRNHIPLEKTKAPLNFALALKTALSGVKHNITVCITMLVLSLVVVFSGLMTENVIVDMTSFLDLIVSETADSAIGVTAEGEEDFLRAVRADGRVEKIYMYTSLNVTHAGGAELMATVCDDFSTVSNRAVVYKGRFPKYGNEIALAAKYAKQKGFKIGGEIEISANGKARKYLICGLTQVTNYLGRDCLLTREGYAALGALSDVTYYINLVSGTDIDAFNTQIKNTFDVFSTVNVDAVIRSTGGVYVKLITVIVIAVLALSAVIIAFVLYFLVRTMLGDKRRDYGILKSLGFTTKQLILQTALSFMPAVIISTAVGIVISCLAINPLMSLFLSSLGIVKCTFDIPVVFTAVAGVALILLSFGIACLLSLKIKKIAPRSLLVGE